MEDHSVMEPRAESIAKRRTLGGCIVDLLNVLVDTSTNEDLTSALEALLDDWHDDLHEMVRRGR